jgi:hypothetical protein
MVERIEMSDGSIVDDPTQFSEALKHYVPKQPLKKLNKINSQLRGI